MSGPGRLLTVGGLILLVAVMWLPSAAAAPDAEEGYGWRTAGKKGLTVQGLSCLRIHPKNPDLMWAHVHGMGPARSDDGGRTWTVMMNGIPEKARPGAGSQVRVTLDETDEKILYVVIDGQIYRSINAGESWNSITSGALISLSWDKLRSNQLSWEVRVDPKKPNHLQVGTYNDGHHNGGLYESTNGGKSWEEVAGTQQSQSGLGNDTYLVRQSPRTDKIVSVAGRSALWYSDDRGRTFKRNDPGGAGAPHDYRDLSEYVRGTKELFVADVRGIWRSKDAGKKWGKEPLREGDALAIVIDRWNKKRIYAIFHDRGIEMSEDGRHSKWAPFGGLFGAKEGTAEPGGYAGGVIRELVVHPRERKTIYLASPVTGLHRSRDAGASFTSVRAPDDAKAEMVMPRLVASIKAVGVHPAKGGLHLAIDEHGVVYQSADRCASWARVGLLGMAPGLLQPGPGEHSWLAASRALLRSTDDGATWTSIYKPKDPEERIVALHRGKSAAQSPGVQGPGVLRLLLERSGLVVSSQDDGKTWQEGKAPGFSSSETWATNLAVDPANEDHLVIAARSIRQAWSPRDENGGVFESFDGGQGWVPITAELKPGKKDDADARKAKANWNRARLLVLDPGSRLLLYGADEGGLFARPYGNTKGEKLASAPTWVDVTPKSPARPSIPAWVATLTPDQTDTRLVVQLEGGNGETAVHAIAGRDLKALHALVAGGGKAPDEPPKEAPAWAPLPIPGSTVRLSTLAADGQLPGRLLGAEAGGGSGVLIYEIPGSMPPSGSSGAADPGSSDSGTGDPKKEAGEGAPPAKSHPPEGMRAFSAGQDRTLRVWAVDALASGSNDPSQRLSGHEREVTCVALTPDEQFIVTAGNDKTLRIWNASTLALVTAFPVASAINAMAVDDDSEFVYLALEEEPRLLQFELATKATRTFAGHTGPVKAVATSEDVNRLYSAGTDQTIRVWDVKQGSEVNQIAYGKPVTALAVSGDGALIYAAGADATCRTFDATGKELAQLEMADQSAMSALALSPDGAVLYVATQGGVGAHATPGLAPLVTHAAGKVLLTAVTTSIDGKWVFGGDASGGLWLWGAGESVARWGKAGAHESAILGLAVTPDETEDLEAAVDPVAPPGGAEDSKAPDEKPADEKPADGKPADPKEGGSAEPKPDESGPGAPAK